MSMIIKDTFSGPTDTTQLSDIVIDRLDVPTGKRQSLKVHNDKTTLTD